MIATCPIPPTLPAPPAIPVGRTNPRLTSSTRGVSRTHRARWIGWAGLSDQADCEAASDVDSVLHSTGSVPIHLSPTEVVRFYDRYSNGFLWSAFHSVTPPAPARADWEAYRSVNERYADAIFRELHVGDLVWVHNYHLMLVPRLVRERCQWARIVFFLHTPFPPAHLFMRLPHAYSLLDGLLGADAIEMQTSASVGSFLSAVGDAHVGSARNTVVDDVGRRVCVFAGPQAG